MRLKFTRNGDVPLRRKLYRRMLEHGRDAHPNECCGLLLGRFGRIDLVRASRNVHPSPQAHFELDPQDLIDAFRSERSGGPKVLGYYHSHPSGVRYPSATDRARAAPDGKLWVIVGGDGLMMWQSFPHGFEPLSYKLTGL